MNLEQWKNQAQERLRTIAQTLGKMTPGMTYGALVTSTIYPLLTALQQADTNVAALIAVINFASTLGGNLLAEKIGEWKDISEADLRKKLAQEAKSDPALREMLDQLLEKAEAPSRIVQAILSEADKDELKTYITESLVKVQMGLQEVGSRLTIEVEGDRNVVAGASIEDSVITTGDYNVITIVKNYYARTDPKASEELKRKQQALLRTYLQQVINDTGALDLTGIDPDLDSDPQSRRLALASVYTALDVVRLPKEQMALRQRGKRGKAEEDEQLLLSEEEQEKQRQPVLRFVNEEASAVILGDPGSGKTTFVRFLALCLAGQLLENPQANLSKLGEEWTGGNLLPLYVVLRDFAAKLPTLEVEEDETPLWKFVAQRMGRSLHDFIPLLNDHLLTEGGILIVDGLDEVPDVDNQRVIVKNAILDFRRQFPQVRILLTSRIYAYEQQQWRLPDFVDATLASFNPEQVQQFVDRWYDYVAQVRRRLSSEDAQSRANLLKQEIERNPYVGELAERPLLLTLMATLHALRGDSLPEDRAQLYEKSVDLLLEVWERSKATATEQGGRVVQNASWVAWSKAPRAEVLQAIEAVAFEAHAKQRKDSMQGVADIAQETLVNALFQVAQRHAPEMSTVQIVDYIRDRAGLLINRGDKVYSFPHRSFQEYLAARHLTGLTFPTRLVELLRRDPDRWREVAQLAGAKVYVGSPVTVWLLIDELCDGKCEAADSAEATDGDWWAAFVAGKILLETKLFEQMEEASRTYQRKLENVRSWLTALCAAGKLPATDRAAAANVLAKLGDPRPGVVQVANPKQLAISDLAWSDVIGTEPFIMGSDKRKDKLAHDREMPQFHCKLIARPYRISRYPITVAHYRIFVDGKGYEQEKYWTKAGWQWRAENSVTEPKRYSSVFELDNHPQIGVSWYEAVAFCNWLSQSNGLPMYDPLRSIRLPSEAEWERAARGTEGQIYPWKGEWDEKKCNNIYLGLNATSAVGIFPAGNAACGAADMSGNVWEWCSTKWTGNYQDYLKNVDDKLEGSDRRVLRGGSFSHDECDVRCAFRNDNNPDVRYVNIGFRVLLPGSKALVS